MCKISQKNIKYLYRDSHRRIFEKDKKICGFVTKDNIPESQANSLASVEVIRLIN